MATKVVITPKDFKWLLTGGSVEVNNVEIALADNLRWAQIFRIVSQGLADASKCVVNQAEGRG